MASAPRAALGLGVRLGNPGAPRPEDRGQEDPEDPEEQSPEGGQHPVGQRPGGEGALRKSGGEEDAFRQEPVPGPVLGEEVPEPGHLGLEPRGLGEKLRALQGEVGGGGVLGAGHGRGGSLGLEEGGEVRAPPGGDLGHLFLQGLLQEAEGLLRPGELGGRKPP